MTHTIAFANNKGGVGKSTSVCNIGYALAKRGKKVLFIDLDSQANLTSLISHIPVDEHKENIMDAFLNQTLLPVEKIEENIYLVPSSLELATFESRTATDNMRIYLLKDSLFPIEDNFDYILIDCPPALGTITYLAMVAAQDVILVTTPDSLSYSGMMMVGTIIKDVRNSPRLNPDLRLFGIIITKYRSNKVTNAYVKKITSESMDIFLNPIIHEEASVYKAVALNKTIFDYAPDSKTAKAYSEIASTIIQRFEAGQ